MYSKNSSRFISGRNDPPSICYNVNRRMEESNGEEGQTTLSLSLDPTSKKTVSSSRLITVLASKQPALLRDFKGCTGPWWRSNRESLHRREGTENRAQREREKGEMKGYRGSNCAYVSTSWPIQLSIGWQRRILNGTHTHQITRVSYIFGSSSYALEILQLRPAM